MLSVSFSMSFGYYLRKLSGAKKFKNCIVVSFSSRHSSIIELELCNYLKAGRAGEEQLIVQEVTESASGILIFPHLGTLRSKTRKI